MKIYNQDKTQVLTDCDLSKGYLQQDKLFVAHHSSIEEKGHWETTKIYKNGGKDVVWIVDAEGQKEYDEYEDIQVYIPYSESELLSIEIVETKALLQKYKEDVEQVDLFGMERADYEDKKRQCAEMVLRLRELEAQLRNEQK